jgi:hypothetical protein
MLSACGGDDETTFSTPDSAMADGADTAALEAQLRASDAFNDAGFAALSTEQQDCVVSGVAAEPGLAAAALAEAEPSGSEAVALTTILLECAPGMVRELMSDGDPTDDAMLNALSDEQLSCLVDALVADPTVLSDAIEGGDGMAMGLALLDCASDVVAESMAAELGVTTEQAACLLDGDGAFMRAMLAADDMTEEESMSFLDDMFGAFEECGIDMTDLMGEDIAVDPTGDGDTTDDGDAGMVIDQATLDSFRADCAAGDLEACDALFFQSEVGSDDEDFGSTCGGTTDGSTAGMCSYVPPSDDEIAEYRAGCEDGDMEACDDLYYASDIGSDDEAFGATCGGTTDGTEPGTCWLGS